MAAKAVLVTLDACRLVIQKAVVWQQPDQKALLAGNVFWSGIGRAGQGGVQPSKKGMLQHASSEKSNTT